MTLDIRTALPAAPRSVYAVLAGALLALAGSAVAGGDSEAQPTPRSSADIALVAGGTSLVGFGSIVDGSLTLRVLDDVRGFVTLVLIASAEVGAVVEAFVTADGRVTVLHGTNFQPLERFLDGFGGASVATQQVPSLDAAALRAWAGGLALASDAHLETAPAPDVSLELALAAGASADHLADGTQVRAGDAAHLTATAGARLGIGGAD